MKDDEELSRKKRQRISQESQIARGKDFYGVAKIIFIVLVIMISLQFK